MVQAQTSGRSQICRNIHFWIITTSAIVISIIYHQWMVWFPWYWKSFVFEFVNDIIGSLFLVPFLYVAIVFRWRGSLIFWLLSQASIIPVLLYWRSDIWHLLRNFGMPLIPLAAVVIINLEIDWRERQKKLIVEREKERQKYVRDIFRAQENERLRIAQELHDGCIQELLVVANRAQDIVTIGQNKSTKEIREQAEAVRDSILRLIGDLRNLSLDLRPSMLDDLGLIPALRWLADRLNQVNKINTRVIVKGKERKLRAEAEVNIFRMVQEALNNVRRHSGATEALVTLDFTPESTRMMISDNGNGFDVKQTLSKLTSEGKLGIIGMQQRARFLNSSFDIKSAGVRGTTIIFQIAE